MTVDTFTSWRAGVSPEQMREIDRLAESDYGIAPLQLMEVAGLATARVARDLLGGKVTGKAVTVLVGPGNNGGDGLVAARRLRAWGCDVSVLTSYPAGEARGLSAGQLRAVEAAGIRVRGWEGSMSASDLVIDALLGFGARGAPRGAVAEMIRAANDPGAKALALDVPSGLDARSGEPSDPCVKAAATVTLALPKTGLLLETARAFVGRLFVADIGLPPALIRRFDIDNDALFSNSDIVELNTAA